MSLFLLYILNLEASSYKTYNQNFNLQLHGTPLVPEMWHFNVTNEASPFYIVKGVDNNFDVITIRNMIKSIFKSAFQHIRLRDSKKKFTISQNYRFGASHYDIHAAAPPFIDILYWSV